MISQAAKAGVEELNREILLSALENVKSEFEKYNQPKQQMVVGGLIGKTELEYLGLVGLDLGGIGLNKNYLDVNVADPTNDPNHLVIGDAMDLQARFEPGCVNNVIAQLLPLVLMVSGEDTQLNRINAIKRVLEGVNYVTGGGGTVSIEFNDSSGEAAVTETILREIAQAYKFTLEGIRPSLPKTLLSSIRREKDQKSSTISSVSPSQSSNCRKFRFCRG
ncbi:MAG: hypothetical protein A4E53_00823 [Pelotomaculum sp. PtaB.Bin104]|nr:MAG: hypothetical protein A4E53_00823 [Pelotomaculum sp. PtaB.Bin104]